MKELQPGQRFSKLTVIKKVRIIEYKNKKGGTTKNIVYLCKCDCGKEKEIIGGSLISGSTKSCGHCNDIKIGDKHGHLTVLKKVEPYHRPDGRNVSKYLCRCDCGNMIEVIGSSLLNGHTLTCGTCKYHKEIISKHGKYAENHVIYDAYRNMIKRCYDKNNKGYKNYGAKGIRVCRRWYNPDNENDPECIINFFNDMEPTWKEKLTLERIDKDGNYMPSNVRWANKDVQANNRATVIPIDYNNEKYSIPQWAHIFGVSINWLRNKIYTNNYNIKNIFTEIDNKYSGKQNILIDQNNNVIPMNGVYFVDDYNYPIYDYNMEDKNNENK